MPKQNSAAKEITLKEETVIGLPSEGTQLIYSEHMIGMAIGPFVSKIVLGIDNSPNTPTPQFTLVMPTNALHQMAKHIIKGLSDKDAQEKFGETFKSYQESALS